MHHLHAVGDHFHFVGARHAVLGHHKRHARVVVVEPHKRLVQRVRVDVPTHLGVRACGWQPVDVARTGRRGRLGALRELRPAAHLDEVRRVVVEAERIDRLVDQREVAVADEVPVADALRNREELLRVAPAQHRVEERAVRDQVEAVHGVRVTAADLQIARDRKLWLAARLGAHGLAHEAMREVDVVHGAERERAGAQAGSLLGAAVAQVRGAPRLVERRVRVHAVTQALGHDAGVIGDPVRRLALEPAALTAVFRRHVLRQVPVVERHDRRDAVFEQAVDDPAVEIEAFLVRLAVRRGDDARDADRESVGVHP